MIATIIGRLKESTFWRSVSTLVSAGVAGQIILLGAMPVISRLYDPADFGLLAAFSALLSTLIVASSLRYELAIALPKSDRDATTLVRLALLLTIGFTVIVTALVVLFREPVARLIGAPELAHILWFLPLVLAGAGTYRVFNFWSVRRCRFGAIAQTRLLQSGASVVVQVLGGLAGFGVHGLIAGQFAGFTAGTTRLANGATVWSGFGRRDFARMRALALRYIRFPKFDVPAAVIDTISVQLPNFLLISLFSPTVAGWYMLADRLLASPLALVGQAVGQVFYSRSRVAIEEGRLVRETVRIAILMVGLTSVPTLVMFIFGEPIFGLLFGDTWRVAGVFAGWLMLGVSAQFVFSTISLVLAATHGQHLNLWIHSLLLGGKFAAIWYGFIVGEALYAIIGFSLVTLAGNTLAIVAVIAHAKQHRSLAKTRA